MRVILTYDLNDFHERVKQLCLRNGFTECAPMTDDSLMKLPNTTLMGNFPTALAAAQKFVALAQQADRRVVVEKLFVCPCDGAFILESNESC